ncbi:MAG: low affinity iron permease family protein [Actinomycetota bacterium]|nr:low affinity iron permease family protein [Actinomycetota bacterium]
MSEGRTAQVRAEASRGAFDRFAERSAEFVSKAPFFAFCLALVVVWAPSYFLVDDFDTYQLLINTPTTIITFLLVALLQNTQRRAERAIHKKLDALPDGMADRMRHFAQDDNELHKEIEDLKAAVGLEEEV